MANVWKVGSRWSSYGAAGTSIVDIFRRNNYVFVGSAGQRFKESVKKGDYLAIADGLTIVAVAKVLDDKPSDLCELMTTNKLRFRSSDRERFDYTCPEEYEGWCFGVRVHLVDLPEHERFKYEKRGTFFSANQYWTKIIKLYHRYSSQAFDITSRTLRIRKTGRVADAIGYEKHDLLDGKTVYSIPIYQREYSWTEDQLIRFIHDMFVGYWGSDPENRAIVKDPMFIGTMQLTQKKYISSKECCQDIIDGQQRISSLLCLLKYISLNYPDVPVMKQEAIQNFDWLQTRVNNDKENQYLRELCDITDISLISRNSDNVYVRNCAIISDVFQQNITDDKGGILSDFDINDFCEYLLNSIYFVVVETVAGLSKTVQIFNTINTAGLDLNGDDIFKVRLYEYLHDKCGESDDAFNEIGKVYERIKGINEKWKAQGNSWDVINMVTVRDAYKDYLISRFDLNNGLYQMSTDTFFEFLFDILLNVQGHKDFGKNVSKVLLDLNQLNQVVDFVYQWNSSYYETPEQLIAYKLIEKSRYGRYGRICYLLLLFGFTIQQVYQLLLPLAKVYFCHSIYNAKTINEIHTFTYNFEKAIGKGASFDELMKILEDKLNQAKQWKEWLYGRTLDKPVWRDLMCTLSAYFDEIEANTPVKELDEKLSEGYDIEHIHANADTIIDVEDYDLQNSIGNLVLLESYINRSIQNIEFKEKVDRSDGNYCYKDSKYASIAKIRMSPKWDTEEITMRRDSEYKKILAFIWGI